MSDEREEFSKRLAAAMRAAGEEPRPSVLFRQFNSTYSGRSVSFQTASRWLTGKSIPEQDKLQVVAALYGMLPQTLRYGDKASGKISERRAAWPDALNAVDRATFDAYLALPAERRRLARDLIQALAGPAA